MKKPGDLQNEGPENHEVNKQEDELMLELKKIGIELENPGQRYIFGSDPNARKAIELLIHRAGPQPTPSSERSMLKTVGKLSICVAPNPTAWEDTEHPLARWLDLAFEGPEWDALFPGLLDAHGGMEVYPKLYRIDDFSQDVAYSPNEIEALRQECVIAQSIAADPKAIEALQKLVFACDVALKEGFGIYLASD